MADDTRTAASAASPAASSAAPSTASSQTPASSTAAPATGAPASSPGTAQDPIVPSGEPPKERWDSILANARKKEREAAESEYRQKYGKYDQFETDPWAAVQAWLDQAATHSLYGEKVTNYAAKLLQSRRGSTPRFVEEPQPDVPIVNGQGQITGYTYSADRLKQWREWDWAQKQAEINERIKPLEQMRQSHEETQVRQQLEAQAWTQTASLLEQRRNNPFFKQHESAIKAEFMAHEEYGDNVDAAAFTVLTRDVLPKLSATEQQKVLDHLQTQAAGGTVSPSAAAPTGRPTFRKKDGSEDFGAALKWMAEHPEEAATLAKR